MALVRPSINTARMSPWSKKVVEILWDGEWHSWDAVIADASALVPPGQAFRQAERDRVRNFEMRGVEPQDRRRGDHQTAIQSGARSIVTDSITGLRQRDRIESEVLSDGTRRIRLKMIEVEDAPPEPEPQSTNGSTPSASQPKVGDAPSPSKQRGPRIIVYPTSDGRNVHEVTCDICRITGFVSSQDEAILALAEHVKERHGSIFRAVATYLAKGPVGNSQLALDNVQTTR